MSPEVSSASSKGVPFNDLGLSGSSVENDVRAALERVVASGWYILGPEVESFEKEIALAFDCGNAVAVGNGTDAITLALLALGIGPGDEVVTTPLTAAFTALAVSRLGATPVFADVEADTLTLSAESVERHVTPRTRAILPVHLYGNACDLAKLEALSRERGLPMVEDACQAHGARYQGQTLGSFAEAGTFSFYPTKNLGALGDGGMVVTGDAELAARLRRLRNGGQSTRYVHEDIGFNSRLDEMQAAVLRAKLPHLERENERRRELARLYENLLSDTPVRPVAVREGSDSARHLFVIRVSKRDELVEHLKSRGIQTLIHYPIPTHLQPAYRHLAQKEGSCPEAEKAAGEILSLPLYPRLSTEDVHRVADAIRDFHRG
jgi:dTDP-3-amino-3,4,6-trideoxy-alpha-D-glucose transaminase